MRSRGCALRRKPRETCKAPQSSRSSLSRRQRRRPRRRQRLSRLSPPIHKSSTCQHMTPGSCTGPGLTPLIRPITGTHRDTWPAQGCCRSRQDLSLGPRSGGNCDWRGGDVNINIDRYSQFTKIDRANVRNTWQHNAEHRRGTPYRDRGSQQRFGQRDVGGAQTREAFRGRAEQGRQELARGGQGPGQTREAGAFSGVGNGAQARTYSDRGYSSRGGGGGFSGYSGGSDRGGGGFSRGSGGFSHGGGFSRGGGGDVRTPVTSARTWGGDRTRDPTRWFRQKTAEERMLSWPTVHAQRSTSPRCLPVLVTGLIFMGFVALQGAEAQQSFRSPEKAIEAFSNAVRAGDTARLLPSLVQAVKILRLVRRRGRRPTAAHAFSQGV